MPGKGALAAIGARRRTVKTIEKITGTMKLVASAQLARDAKTSRQTAPFFLNFEPIFGKLPENKSADKKSLTVLMTSSRGLCGALNAMLIRDVLRAPDFAKQTLFVYGDKGAQAMEKRPGENEKVFGSAHPGKVISFAEFAPVVSRITETEYDEIKIVFNQFVSMNVFKLGEVKLPSLKYLLDNSKDIDFEYDENKREFFRNLHEYHLAAAMSYTASQNSASETLSRRNAMDNANKNCKELKKKLNIDFNKLRQALITTELIEVTTGAAAVESAT